MCSEYKGADQLRQFLMMMQKKVSNDQDMY